MTTACNCNSGSISDHVSKSSSQASDSGDSNSNKVSEGTQKQDQQVSTRGWGAVPAAMAQQKQPLWPSVHALWLKSFFPWTPSSRCSSSLMQLPVFGLASLSCFAPMQAIPKLFYFLCSVPSQSNSQICLCFPYLAGSDACCYESACVCNCQQMW